MAGTPALRGERDFAAGPSAIQGTVLFLSVVVVLLNLATDVAYKRADPRVS